MTNAKSRLVRIIALALAVLMIVPMALVGCGKDSGVDKAALDEALAAAQAAKDAADKAAKDAQAAIDAANKQIEDAKKDAAEAKDQASKLEAVLSSLQNITTEKPADPSAPVDTDKAVVDAHISDILNNEESEFNKLVDKYDAILAAYAEPDIVTIAKLFSDASVAILRAPTVDYANQLVANLVATLEAVPTYSERVKQAYDAIDFASDKDVVDVAYAYALLAKANADLAAAAPSAQAGKDAVAAEVKAIAAYGEAELDLAALIATEYYRYTGVEVAGADKEAVEEVLYKDIYDEAVDLAIAAGVKALFGGINDETGELEIKDVVYSVTLEDAVEDVKDAYADFALAVKDEDAEDLYEDFCIAFVGAEFILTQEGDYLSAKLAEAEARAAELLAAYDELEEFYDDLVEIVDAYYADATTAYLYFDWNEEVAEVGAQVEAWIEKYGFEYDDANFAAMLGYADAAETITNYQGFVAAKAYTDALGAWNAALEAIDDNDIEDALDEIADTATAGIFDYAENGAAVKALVSWYYTTKDANGKVVNQGIEDAVVKFEEIKAIKDFPAKAITTAAIVELLDEVDVTVANIASLKTALALFEAKGGYLDRIEAIVKEIKDIDLANLTVESLTEITATADLNALATEMKMIADTNAKYGWSSKSLNYDLLPFASLDAIAASKNALVGALLEQAEVIVEKYIGWAGVVEDGYIKFGVDSKGRDSYFKVDAVAINIYSYAMINSLASVYKNIEIFNLYDVLAAGEGVKVANKRGEEIVFPVEQVVSMFRQMSDTYYYVVMNNLNSATLKLRNSAVANATVTSKTTDNEWSAYGASESATLKGYADKWGSAGLTYKYPTSSSENGTGNAINVYATAATGDARYTYVAAIEAVDADNYGKIDKDGVKTFDAAGYKKAVDQKISEYRGLWYQGKTTDYTSSYLYKNTTTLNTLAKDVFETALKNGLWTIEAAVEVDGEDYTVVVKTTDAKYQGTTAWGAAPVAKVTILNDKNKEVAGIVDGNKTYTVSFEIVGRTVVLKANDGTAAVDLATIVDNANAKNAPKYVYDITEAIQSINANNGKIGTGIKQQGGTSSNTYVLYSSTWFTALISALDMNGYMYEKEALMAEAAAAYTAALTAADSNIGDQLIEKAYTEWNNTWEGTAFTAEGMRTLKVAVATIAAELNNLAAKHPANPAN